jgi:hypothetical protein
MKIALLTMFMGIVTLMGFTPCSNQIHSSEPLIIGDNPVDEVFEIDSTTDFYHTGGIMVTGKGVLSVKGTLYQTGNVYITGNGTLRVDGGKFHLAGNDTTVYVDKNGCLTFRNNAVLHYIQDYVGQHNIIGADNARITFHNSWVNCDGSIEFVHLVNNAHFEAVNTTYNDWTTWYLHDETRLLLENVNYAGDIVFYDSPTLTFINTNVVMPWLYFGEGAVINYTFPPEQPVTTVIDNTLPGISGIPWKLTMVNCQHVAWGVNPYPGSDVTIRDSHVTMVMVRFAGEGTFNLQGIMRNNSSYVDKTIPVKDRHFRLVNTSVKWWKVDVVDNFCLNADSIIFSEMVLKDNGKAYLTNSICEGQTIHLGAQHNSFLYFERGEVWSYVSVWDNAVMVLSDSVVDWEKGKFIYQKSNIAHGNSRLYCLNSVLKSKPQAQDSALVMVASITGPNHGEIGEKVSITGSASIDAGPESDTTFSHYTLSWSKGHDWNLIAASTNPVEEGILGTWDTSELSGGEYQLRLTVWVSNDTGDTPTDEYPVYKMMTLFLSKYQRMRCGPQGKIVPI